jgi:hypothetical protein
MRVPQLDIVESFSLLLKDLGFPWEERCYLIQRARTQGLPFLTNTLPRYWKSVLHFVQFNERDEFFSNISLKGASLRRWRLEFRCAKLTPSFLYQLSQICNYYYKLSLPLTSDGTRIAVEKYTATQNSVLNVETIDAHAAQFIERVRRTVESNYNLKDLHLHKCVNASRHGPGSVVGTPNGMSDQAFKDSLDSRYPTAFNGFKGVFRNRVTDIYVPYSSDIDPSIPCKRAPMAIKPYAHDLDYCEVLFVPKDSRGPRVISRETPAKAMLSLGFHDTITDLLQEATHGRIQFTDQTIFKDLAQQASLTGKLATLDLSDASDRHSIVVARRIYRNIPAIRYALSHFRPSMYRIDTSGFKTAGTLRSVAGMGNGLTFPLMALTIHASICTMLRLRGFSCHTNSVYVYGDDIIVPSEVSDLAIEALHLVGFKVNTLKSFTKGMFRESCGGDYYDGVSITPIRLKQTFCDNFVTTNLQLQPDSKSRDKNNADKFFAKLEAHTRLLVESGLTGLANYYYSKIDSYLKSKRLPCLPVNDDITSGGLIRYSPYCAPTSVNEPLVRFVSKLTLSNYNRQIRRKLGPVREHDSLRRWLNQGRTSPFLFKTHLCRDTNYFELRQGVPIRDTLRYSGSLQQV